jgi:hypothetical protein
MAITWRNINGPSFGAANQLLAQGSKSVVSGLDSLRGVAQDISAQGTQRYETQADVNTASILSNINRLDAEGLKNFDVSQLEQEYGTQFDSSALMPALNNREGNLQATAQQDLLNQRNAATDVRADTALQLDQADSASRNKLNESRGLLAQQQQDKANKIDAFSNTATGSIGTAKSAEELTQSLTKQAVEAGLTANEASSTINSVLGVYNQNIGNTQGQLDAAEALQGEATLRNQEYLRKQGETLDAKAKNLGLTPVMLDMQSDNEESIDKVYAEFDAASEDAEAIFGREDSTNKFKSEFTKLFNRPPSSKEARYWLSRSFDEGVGLSDDGLNHDLIKDDLLSYKKMLGDSATVNWYKDNKFKLAKSGRDAALAQGKKLSQLLQSQRESRQATYNGTSKPAMEVNDQFFLGTRSESLLDPNWLNK